MPHPIHLMRAGRAAVAVGFALAALPAAAQAAPVNLATAGSFSVLGAASVTNTGPSTLFGDLGVSPGTALTGFNTATINGATHANDAVAAQAQQDLTTAYDVAAAEPVPPGNVLTGTNLGNRTLLPGAYRYATSAGLTGALTLDAQGDPNAQFVFEIGSTLTTASASSVVMINGASPCNVYWQVGSSATLGTSTAFQGNVMALADISANTGATVQGRLLARNAITLDTNVIDNNGCATPTPTPTPGTPATPTPGTPATPTPGTPASGSSPTGATSAPAAPIAPPASKSKVPTRRGTARLSRTPGPRDTPRGAPGEHCTVGFRATVRGREIERVVFTLDGRRIANRTGSPFSVSVKAGSGRHYVRARVTFKDATRARTLTYRYRACAAAVLQPRRGPSQFTG